MGWPMAIAPPLTLTLRCRSRALYCRAGLRGKGFVGLDEIEIVGFPACLFNAAREEGMGPMPMTLGSTPALAQTRCAQAA